jgi:hypothetical protein
MLYKLIDENSASSRNNSYLENYFFQSKTDIVAYTFHIKVIYEMLFRFYVRFVVLLFLPKEPSLTVLRRVDKKRKFYDALTYI